jgi:hypothetical protein
MVYRGHVKNGVVIVDDESVALPDGVEVRVEIVSVPKESPAEVQGDTLYDQLQPLIGAADGLPADLARNHDLYLHGQFRG